MCDVRKRVVRLALTALGAGLMAGALGSAKAQVANAPLPDTNGNREARIARTIEDTYSHRWELFGGGGFLRFHSGEQVAKNNEVSWAVNSSYFLNRKLAVVAQTQGSFGYGREEQGGTVYSSNITRPQINEYFFLGGVGYRVYSAEKFAVMPEVMGGAGWGIFGGGSKGFSTADLGLFDSGTRPAVAAGVNFDYNFYPNLAFRLTPLYMATTYTSPEGGSVQNNFGFNAGVVYRFGRR
jgi:hypothetical protein